LPEAIIRAVRPGDVKELVANLRDADRLEIMGMHTSLEAAARYSVERSRYVAAAECDGRLVCIFGVGSMGTLSDTGVPWLLGTNEMRHHRRAVLEKSREYVPAMLVLYPVLRNYVDARYTEAVRWLKWLGFDVKPAQRIGRRGELYHPFEMRADTHV